MMWVKHLSAVAATLMMFGMIVPDSARAETPVAAPQPAVIQHGRAGTDTAPVADLSAKARRPRVRIYPRRQHLGPRAVRQCSVRYVQEFRPSGTVIVPRMHCWWERG